MAAVCDARYDPAPVATVPTYCATKAGLHSYMQSLRYQLKGTIDVVELIQPYVQTDPGPNHSTDPRAMPLAEEGLVSGGGAA